MLVSPHFSRAYALAFVGIFLFVCQGHAQTIQDCLGAIPVCQKVYVEDQAPIGNGDFFDFSGDDNCLLGENNSIWYTFTVNNSGQFGFLLTPNDPTQDYDWILFDITSASCPDIRDDPSLVVSCNAAGLGVCNGPTGATGATEFSSQGPNCGGFPPTQNAGFSPFNDLIAVEAGNTYALCILNFSATSSKGYTIDFGLSTDIGIFDETPPTLETARYPGSCNGSELSVRFSEFIQCSTISAANFQLTGTGEPYNITLSSASCDIGGNYSKAFKLEVTPAIPFEAAVTLDLVVDGSTEVLDLCGNPATPGSISFGGPTLTEGVDLGPDTTLCAGEILTLDSDFAGSYFWSDGSNGATLEVSQSGTYWLTIETPCGPTSDTIEVSFLDSGLSGNVLGEDTIICPSGTIELNATTSDATYRWQDGSSAPTLLVDQPGIYAVTVTHECGEVRDEIVISSPEPITAEISDTSLCAGASFTYDVTTPNASYQWQDGSTTPTFQVTEPGTYTVTIATACETVTRSATVTAKSGELASVDLGPDTTLCAGETLLLELTAPADASIVWQDGSTGASFLADQPGTYAVTVSNVCGEAQDEIAVEYAPPVTATINDTSLCSGESLTWDVTTPGATYQWQDGSTAPTFQVTGPDNYTVTIATACETVTRSATVTAKSGELASVDLGPDTTLCEGETLMLTLTAPADASIAWQDGSTDASFLVDQPGTYAVTVSNACGSKSDEIQVQRLGRIDPDIARDTFVCPGETILLNAETNNANFYRWPDGTTKPTFLVEEPGQYIVLLANECEETTATIEVEACEQCNVYLPNAISPNGDGVNDKFKPFSSCALENYVLRIFSRWGDLIYETGQVEDGWDGTYNGQEVDIGVYVYAVEFNVVENGEVRDVMLSGSITVVR